MLSKLFENYNLFLESCIDEDTIPKIKKIIMDRLEGEIIDDVELTEMKTDKIYPSITNLRMGIRHELKMNQFSIIEINYVLGGKSLLLFIKFQSDKIKPYINLISEEIKDLGFNVSIYQGERPEKYKEDIFNWEILISGGF